MSTDKGWKYAQSHKKKHRLSVCYAINFTVKKLFYEDHKMTVSSQIVMYASIIILKTKKVSILVLCYIAIYSDC